MHSIYLDLFSKLKNIKWKSIFKNNINYQIALLSHVVKLLWFILDYCYCSFYILRSLQLRFSNKIRSNRKSQN